LFAGAGFVAAALAAGALAPAFASPWNRTNGGVFVSTKIDYFASSTAVSRYRRLDTDNYLEWGATSRLMAGGKLLYGQAWSDDALSSTSASGVSEAAGFIQAQLLRTRASAFALKVAGGVEGDAFAGARPGAADGGGYIDARLLFGQDIIAAPVKIFAAAEAGYRARIGASASQWRLDGQIGVSPASRLLVLAGADAIVATGSADPGGDDYDVVKLSASAVWRFSTRYSLIAGVRKEVAARNIEPGRSVFLGLWTEF